jgi:hypothetical protein
MSETHIVVNGTLNADGTLQLDERPNLPSGRVRVTMQAVAPDAPDDDFMTRMEAVWAAQKARGYTPPTREQVDAELAALRDEAEEEMREVERLSADCRRRPDTSGMDQGPSS